jgi:hypothetical protein
MLCVSVNPPTQLNFACLTQFLGKLVRTLSRPPEPIPTAYLVNLSYPSVCVYIFLSMLGNGTVRKLPQR